MLEAYIVEYVEADGTLMAFSCDAESAEDARRQCAESAYVSRIVSTYRRY